MGINNLLKTLEKIKIKRNISFYANKVLGVDGHCWLHKSLYLNIYDEEFNIQSDSFLRYIKKRIDMMKNSNISIVFVVDGEKPELKGFTNFKRKLNREKNIKKIPKDFDKSLINIRKQIISTLEIDKEMIEKVKVFLENEGKKFVQAPYEADLKLSELYRNKEIDGIITEDSDLIAHGNNDIIYKLDKDGECEVYNSDDYNKIDKFKDFSKTQFVIYCILCGCDYLKLPKIGPSSAYKILKENLKNENIVEDLDQKCKYLLKSILKNFNIIV